MTKARIGLVGLAVMGANLALNIAEKGFPVAVYNRTAERTDDFMAEAGSSMIALGSQLSAFDTQKRATAIQKLQTFATDLPSPDRVTSMAMSHDLLSLDEFTSLFTKPVDISPPWDGVWPAPSSIVL